MDSKPEYVWYCSYGSNLLRQRFYKYIVGGPVPGASRVEKGARDHTLPLAEKCLILDRSFLFAKSSKSWSHGGVAFIEHSSNNKLLKLEGNHYADGTSALSTLESVLENENLQHCTIAKAYLITKEQFIDVTRQENSGHRISDQDFELAMEQAVNSHSGSVLLHKSWYGRILYLGRSESPEDDTHSFPIYSFTSDEDFDDEVRPPSEFYARTIIKGLRECIPQLTLQQVCDYLCHKKGICDYIDRSALFSMIQLEFETNLNIETLSASN